MPIMQRLSVSPLTVAASNGSTYVGFTLTQLQAGTGVALGVPAAAILLAVQAWLVKAVDSAAEQLRNTVLIPGSGQAMEYQELQGEATAALADSAATAAKYPMLAASIGIDVDPSTGQPAVDVLGVARCVAALYAAWRAFGGAIRAARLKGTDAVMAAADVPTACAAFDAIVWPVMAAPAAPAAAPSGSGTAAPSA